MGKKAAGRKILLLTLIFIFGLSLRLYHFNWDQGQHLHPDGRFLTMVSLDLRRPHGWGEYFSSRRSPLNPFNRGYNFFVYGPLPLVLTKFTAQIFHWASYAKLNLMGRIMAATFDSFIILLLYTVSRGLWAPFFYALMVLPIQLSHFYTVDPFANFFLALGLAFLYQYYRRRGRYYPWWLAGTGFALGLAAASKISALLGAVFMITLLMAAYCRRPILLLKRLILLTVALVLAIYLAAPIYFQAAGINPDFWRSWQELRSWFSPHFWFPPSVQWFQTHPWLFPAENILLWELGLPMGTVFLLAVFKLARRWRRPEVLVPLAWILFVFIIRGSFFVKAGRYFLPMYPAIAFIMGLYFEQTMNKKFAHLWQRVILLFILASWTLLFMNVYRQNNSRLAASQWIYRHLPAGATLSCEYWDDCLPLPLVGRTHFQYHQEILHLYAPDSLAKWQQLSRQLSKVDYLILSSNRLWKSIPKAPDRYPVASRFYKLLFAGRLNFYLCRQFTNSPGVSFRGRQLWAINDQAAEEIFTVYDHPTVLIYCRREFWSAAKYLKAIYRN